MTPTKFLVVASTRYIYPVTLGALVHEIELYVLIFHKSSATGVIKLITGRAGMDDTLLDGIVEMTFVFIVLDGVDELMMSTGVVDASVLYILCTEELCLFFSKIMTITVKIIIITARQMMIDL